MSLCENCISLDVCTGVDKNKEACFFFSPTEDYRIRNSKEYAIGYEQGRVDCEKAVLDVKPQIYKWLIKRDKEGYGTTLGECTDKIFEEIEKAIKSIKQ